MQKELIDMLEAELAEKESEILRLELALHSARVALAEKRDCASMPSQPVAPNAVVTVCGRLR